MEFYTGSIVFGIMGEKNSSTWSAGQWIVSSGHSSLSNPVSHFSEMKFRRQALNAKLASLRYCADCKLLVTRRFGWNRHLQCLHWGWWEKGLAIVIFNFQIHLPQSITVKSLANWIRISVCRYCRSFRLFIFGGRRRSCSLFWRNLSCHAEIKKT